MSLTTFVDRPAIKDAFKTFATRERTPIAIRKSPIIVPSVSKYPGLVGIAFDYLARFYIAHKLRNSGTKIYEDKWIAESGIDRLDWVCRTTDEETQWRHIAKDARLKVTQYISGAGDFGQLVDISQNLANLDLLTRSPKYFNPQFKPLSEIGEEALSLVDLFSRTITLSECELCILNPQFTDSPRVGGADADLIMDDRLVEFKTTKNLAVSERDLLQLSGYAALQKMGGAVLGEEVHNRPIQYITIYFARYAKLARWKLSDLFPGDGFSRFTEVFEAEVALSDLRLNELRWRHATKKAEKEKRPTRRRSRKRKQVNRR